MSRFVTWRNVLRRHLFAIAIAAAFCAFGALPATYQAVEWIESHGKEGVDLGFSPPKAGGTAIDVDFEMKSSDANTRQTVCACGTFDFNRYLFMSQNGAVYFNLSTLSTPYVKDQRIRFTADTAAKYTLSLDGVVSKTGTGGLANNSYPGNLTLFNCGSGFYGHVRLYSASFATNGIVDGVSTVLPVRKLVACVRTSDNVAGLYDLVEGEFYENNKAGAFTYGCIRGMSDDIQVVGDPVECGTPNPGYGFCGGYSAGQEVSITLPRVGMNVDESIQGTCTGYTVYTNGFVYVQGSFDESSGDDVTVVFDHPSDCDYGAKVVLHWDARCKVGARPSNPDSGTVSKDYEWHAPGETFTVTAEPTSGHCFYRWLGSDGVEYGRDPTLEMTVADAIVITAVFTDVRPLAPSGEDDSDALIALIDASQEGDFISLAAGTYKISKTIEIAKNVQIVGADRDTTIVEGDGKVRIFKIVGSTAPDALLANLTIQKGCGCGAAGNNGEGVMVNYGGGAALLDQGGTIRNCIIEKSVGSGNVCGHGVQIVGNGKIVGSIIRNITGGYDLAWGQALIAGDGALVDHCVISNVQATALRGSTAPVELYGSGTEMRNCLITGCKYELRAEGAVGVYFRTAGAKLTSCTIAGNSITSASGYAVRGSGTVKNCIVADNLVNTAIAAAESDVASEVATSHSFTRPLMTGVGNVTADIAFKAGSFELPTGSPAIGNGEVEGWMADAKDLKDGDRLRDGKVDMGAYAYVPSALACSISCAADKKVLDAIDATILSSVEGNTEGIAYSWKVNGAEAGTGTSFNLKTSDPGTYSVVLEVENASGDTAASETIVFTIVPSTIYVDSTSTEPVSPYGDPAHAAANLQDAVDSAMDGCVVVVAPGTYALAKTLYVQKKLVIRSSGNRDNTIIHVGGNFPGVSLEVAGSEFAGFTVEHGYMSKEQYANGGSRGGGNLYAGEGTLVHDCRFSDASCYGHDPVMGGTSLGVYNATVRDCEIVDNARSNRGSNWQMYRGAVQVSGANSVVERCLFEGNVHVNAHRNGEWRCVAGLYLVDGVVRNCLFRSNGMTDSGTGSSNVRVAAAYVAGGTLENCTFVGNTITRAGTDAPPAGVYADGGTIRNCIVWDNVSSAGDVANWGGTEAKFTYCCTTPALSDEHSLSSNPKFKRGSAWLGDVRWESPCANGGLYYAGWMDGAMDFFGRPFLRGGGTKRVPIGCASPVVCGAAAIVR